MYTLLYGVSHLARKDHPIWRVGALHSSSGFQKSRKHAPEVHPTVRSGALKKCAAAISSSLRFVSCCFFDKVVHVRLDKAFSFCTFQYPFGTLERFEWWENRSAFSKIFLCGDKFFLALRRPWCCKNGKNVPAMDALLFSLNLARWFVSAKKNQNS